MVKVFYNNKDEEVNVKYDWWVWTIFGILVVLAFPKSLISLLVFFTCKNYFEDWAYKMGRNPIVPFFLVLIFSLAGHLGYYIYYKYQTK